MKQLRDLIIISSTLSLTKGEFKELLPELYSLSQSVENNIWHVNEDVFSHTLSVLAHFLSSQVNSKSQIKIYLQTRLVKHCKKELLLLAILLHDIGKAHKLVKAESITSSKGHEMESGKMAVPILKRLGLHTTEINYVYRLIINHGKANACLNNYGKDNFQELFSEYQHTYHDILPELMIMAIADTQGSHLSKTRAENYLLRISIFENLLNSSVTKSL